MSRDAATNAHALWHGRKHARYRDTLYLAYREVQAGKQENPNRSGSVNTRWEKRAPEVPSLDMLVLKAVHFFSWSVVISAAPTEKAGEGSGLPIVSAPSSTAQSMRGWSRHSNSLSLPFKMGAVLPPAISYPLSGLTGNRCVPKIRSCQNICSIKVCKRKTPVVSSTCPNALVGGHCGAVVMPSRGATRWIGVCRKPVRAIPERSGRKGRLSRSVAGGRVRGRSPAGDSGQAAGSGPVLVWRSGGAVLGESCGRVGDDLRCVRVGGVGEGTADDVANAGLAVLPEGGGDLGRGAGEDPVGVGR